MTVSNLRRLAQVFLAALMLGLPNLAAAQNLPTRLHAHPNTAIPLLTVVNGTYDATIAPGAVVDVWASPSGKESFAGMVFDHWSGDTQTMVDPNEWHTKLTIPQTPITITAIYRSAPTWTTTTETIGEDTATSPPTPITRVFYFPQAPAYTQPLQGVIFMFHGTGGSATTVFTGTEDDNFARDAVAAGYAIVSLDSSDRVNKQWDNTDPPASNPDIQNVEATVSSFISRGFMTASTPLIAAGMSNGGEFGPTVAYDLGWSRSLIWCSSDSASIVLTNTVPTIWDLQQNDDSTFGTTGDTHAEETYAYFLTKGVTAQLESATPTPVYPLRFWRIGTLTQSDSITIYNLFKSNGYLDANDFLLADPNTETTALTDLLPLEYLADAYQILTQLNVAYTAHQFYSDNDHRVLQFIANPQSLSAVSGTVTLLGSVNEVQPINMTFRPASGSAFTQTVTLSSTGAFTVTNVLNGSYTLAIKGAKWLQTDISVNTTGGAVTGVSANLIPGDANNDNVIDISDFSLLTASYGLSVGQAGYNDNVDFTCDGVIDLNDFSLLAQNYGLDGNP